MDSVPALVLVVGTAAITALVMSLMLARPDRPATPTVVYVPVPPAPPADTGAGCLPLVILALVVIGALLFL